MGDSLILDLAVFKVIRQVIKSKEDKDRFKGTYYIWIPVVKRVLDCERLTVPVNHHRETRGRCVSQ